MKENTLYVERFRPTELKYYKDWIGDYGKVTVKSDGTNIFISFIVPEDEY
jgi:hypothetical protein